MTENKLREIRIQKGMSQLELSRLTKIASTNLSNMENGRQYIYPGWKKRIAKALGVPISEIFPEKEG